MKKFLTKVVSLLLCGCMLLGMAPITVFAQAEVTVDGDAAAENYLILANDYDELGTWSLVTGEEGSWDNVGYIQGLNNRNSAGSSPAVATVDVKTAGTYYLWASAKHFTTTSTTRYFNISVNDTQLDHTFGQVKPAVNGFYWEGPYEVTLTEGTNTVKALDTSAYYARLNGILLTSDADLNPSAMTYAEIEELSENINVPTPVSYSESFDTMPNDIASVSGWEIVPVKDGYALKGTTATDNSLLATFDSLGNIKAPYTIVVDMSMEFLETAGNGAGITFGKTSSNTFYHYRMNRAVKHGPNLYHWNNGSVNQKLVDNEYEMPIENLVPFRLRVTYDGTTINCYTNGIKTYSLDQSVPSGAVGFRIYNTIAYIDNLTVTSGVTEPPAEGDIPSLELLDGDPIFWNNEDDCYSENSGNWSTVAGVGHDGSDARVAEGGYVSFEKYPPETGRYIVSYYLPSATDAVTKITVTTMDGTWKYDIPAGSEAGWYRLGVVSATEGTVLSVSASSEGTIYADAIKIEPTKKVADPVYNPVGGSEEVAVLVNQVGYDCGTSKRATVPNVADGTEFKVLNAYTGEIVFVGAVQNGIADFTELDSATDTDYYIECADATSYVFTIGEDIIQRRSVQNALAFMNETRSDTFCVGIKSIGWRDGTQFSFELNGLVLQYMANPALFENMEYGIVEADTCEYEELRIQDEPDIVWLMQFAALRYYDLGCIDGNNLHMLTKEQLAYFLYIYPEISKYVSEETYEKIRDYTISVWGVNACNLEWHAVKGTNHDLYALQTVFGGLKGSQPPGHSIVPNLMMYEVAMRDGLGEDVAKRFFDAAYNNCAWLISEEFDLNDPFYNKGQRMSEYITVPSLAYFLEMYPDKAPKGLKAAIEEWAQITILRSDNMWDNRMAVSEAAGDFKYFFHNPALSDVNLSEEYWTGAAYANADRQNEYLDGGAPKNEPGSQAGLQAVTYAAARVLDSSSTTARLKAIGVAAIDDLYGRNPSGMAAFFDFTRDFEGGDLGWYKQFKGGYGVLERLTGVIDGNAPEGCYPYNPEAYTTGYTEGWVSYNTAWNASLAYAAADSISLEVDAYSGKAGDEITITLHAPNNLDNTKQESAYVFVKNILTGETDMVTVTENGTSSSIFTASYVLPDTNGLEISYGHGLFENKVAVQVEDSGDVDGDGSVTIVDALLILRAVANGRTIENGDINGDGKVSLVDVLRVLKLIVQ